MDRSTTSFLRESELWRRLPPAMLAQALAATTRIRLRRSAMLWAPGDAATTLHVVRSGVIRIHQPTRDSEGLTLALYGRGDLCGEGTTLTAALGAPSVRYTRAVAHDDAVLLAMPVATLTGFMQAYPTVGTELAALVARRRCALETRLSRLPLQSVPERLDEVLSELATRFGVRDSRGLILNVRLTHRDLAAFVGSTRETVSACLARWRREGRIEVDGRRLVLPSGHERVVSGANAPHILPSTNAG